jgi:hypothetical protein
MKEQQDSDPIVEPEDSSGRIRFLDRWFPRIGCRVIGIPGSVTWGGRRGLLTARHPQHLALVQVCWDDDPTNIEPDVPLILLKDEPVLDQMSRISDGK